MNKKHVIVAAVGFLILFGLSLPAEAQGFRFGVGVNFGFGGVYFSYGRPWCGPAYYPHRYMYYAPYAPYFPYAPVTVMRAPYPARVYRAFPPRPVRAERPYGRYVPRRYVRGVIVSARP
jgi:hypothetical protein